MILFEDKVTGSDKAQFIDMVKTVSKRIGAQPDWLMAMMAFETGYTFSASIKNPNGGATGLIQFMPQTAIELGTTTAALAQMNRTDQLDVYVTKYYQKWINAAKTVNPINPAKIDDFTDLYLITFYPAYWVQKEPDSKTFPPIVVQYNPGVFIYGNTLGAWKQFLRKKFAAYPQLFKPQYGFTLLGTTVDFTDPLTIAIIAGASLAIYLIWKSNSKQIKKTLNNAVQ